MSDGNDKNGKAAGRSHDAPPCEKKWCVALSTRSVDNNVRLSLESLRLAGRILHSPLRQREREREIYTFWIIYSDRYLDLCSILLAAPLDAALRTLPHED